MVIWDPVSVPEGTSSAASRAARQPAGDCGFRWHAEEWSPFGRQLAGRGTMLG